MSTFTVEIDGGMGRRRQYGQGTVRCRNGTWQIAYHPIPGGRRVFETVGKESAGVTREAAEHLLMERLVSIGKGQGAQYLGHPFDQVAKEWRRTNAALAGLSTRAKELIDVAIDCHLLPAFGDDYLHQISVGDIERYAVKKMTIAPGQPGAVPTEGKIASTRPEPVGIRSIEQQLSVMSRIFQWAKREGLVAENPVDLVELSKPARAKKQIVPMEQDQVKAVLENSGDEERETMLLTLVSLGLRLGELLALDLSDLDLKRNTLTIRRTLTTDGGKTVISPYPKTSSGYRTLKLSPTMTNRLRRQTPRAKARHKDGEPKILFANKRGRVRGEGNFRRDVWRPTLDTAGVSRDFTPHSLRHTFASEQIAAGVPATQLAYLMGHANASTTMSIYASVMKRHEASQADIADLYS